MYETFTRLYILCYTCGSLMGNLQSDALITLVLHLWVDILDDTELSSMFLLGRVLCGRGEYDEAWQNWGGVFYISISH